MDMLNTLFLRLYVGTVARTRDERGDVPGWVLVTIMTAGLVMAIWAVAGITMPPLLRRSPVSCDMRTMTRSCSIWISSLASVTRKVYLPGPADGPPRAGVAPPRPVHQPHTPVGTAVPAGHRRAARPVPAGGPPRSTATRRR